MFSADHYQIICSLFPRLLGALYFVALSPLIFQIKGLIGKKGILPVSDFLALNASREFGLKRFLFFPTIFWWRQSDLFLVWTAGLGTCLSLLLLMGGPPWLLLPPLIVIHLSFVVAGQDFLSFGWEMFLLEISYNAFFLSLTNQPNVFVWISLNLLLFRFHLQAGASKLQTYDPTWRNLTSLCYHYQTQPIPNRMAWYMHKLPVWFHKCSTAYMFFVELVVPFGVFGGEFVRLISFIFIFLLQASIAVSGNYSYLNYMTVALATILISDHYLSPFFGGVPPQLESLMISDVLASLGGMVLITLQLMQLWNHFFRSEAFTRFFSKIYSLHFANRYGIFAIMTTTRYEIVIEGSNDQHNWKEYLFLYKPSEVTRCPRLVAPFQPRLDCQMWFLPFSRFGHDAWFVNFLEKLLDGEPSVLKLLRFNPFPEKPPDFIRSIVYVYEFSSKNQKKKSGLWWVRNVVQHYSPIRSKTFDGSASSID